ncbi:sporulation domain-containing protein [Salinisphaera sp. PC39]|uniref:SPOR domain-containing protein n=1 Tax=Salinisphaera sp. PC39 TaxID=1304156 RepID=UPI003341DE67
MNEVMKRRLTGAAVLVVLGVLVPFGLVQWLDGTDTGGGEDVRVYEITPDGGARPISETASDPGAATGGGNAADTADRGEPASAVPSEPESEAEPGPTVDDRETTADAEPAPAPEPEPEPVNVPTGPAPPAEDEPAGPAWSVQVGSFRSEDNARGLMQTLAADFPAFYAEGEVDGTTYYRVRVGPYPSEAEAESAAEALKARGRSAQVRRESP